VNQNQSLFLKNVVPAAIKTQRITGIPASVTIAQAILESSNAQGWGQSALARLANNYFGIKATHNAAAEDYMEFPTTEFVDGRKTSVMAAFARYATPDGSFLAHAKLISTLPRYAPAMKACSDPQKFAEALQTCGYSTNPAYAAELMQLVRLYDLTQYDTPPVPPAQAQNVA